MFSNYPEATRKAEPAAAPRRRERDSPPGRGDGWGGPGPTPQEDPTPAGRRIAPRHIRASAGSRLGLGLEAPAGPGERPGREGREGGGAAACGARTPARGGPSSAAAGQRGAPQLLAATSASPVEPGEGMGEGRAPAAYPNG